MPSPRERQQSADRDDRELVDRAARWLRYDPARREHAGLQHDHHAHALADLLDALAAGVPTLDRAVRWQAVQSCRVLLGETMESPTIRRTRRRGSGTAPYLCSRRECYSQCLQRALTLSKWMRLDGLLRAYYDFALVKVANGVAHFLIGREGEHIARGSAQVDIPHAANGH
jgi:hypothetical protein